MAVLADTSVLVAASVRADRDHAACKRWLSATWARTVVAFSTHAAAETFSVLTNPRGSYRLPLPEAERIVTRLRNRLQFVSLSTADYRAALTLAVERGAEGPQVYDALHVQAARKVGAARIATLDTRHYSRLWPPSRLIRP